MLSICSLNIVRFVNLPQYLKIEKLDFQPKIKIYWKDIKALEEINK